MAVCTALVVVGGTIAGALLAPVVLPVLGFGAAGIIAGSWAAAIMTPLTVAGSWFAILQSIGATGALVTTALGAQIGFGVSALFSTIYGIFN